jgi:hypothetical protein
MKQTLRIFHLILSKNTELRQLGVTFQYITLVIPNHVYILGFKFALKTAICILLFYWNFDCIIGLIIMQVRYSF